MSRVRRLLAVVLTASLLGPGQVAWAPAAWAAESAPATGQAATARLLTAEDAVRGTTLSAGLAVTLEPGWKTYWRSPGEVGLPPALDWSGSANVADVELAYPAPQRFTAFDIENYGYSGQVVFPLSVRVGDPARPVRLHLRADLLVCAEICIPETLDLGLDLPAGGDGTGRVDAAAAATLSDWVARVPGRDGFALTAVHLDDDALTLTARADAALSAPQVFPEAGGATFGPPDIRAGADGRTMWARLPVTAPPRDAAAPIDVTLVDGDRAATLRVAGTAAAAPPPPDPAEGRLATLARMMLLAALGGSILNVMPCVLPVLSIKLAAALQARDRPARAIRAGFLASAAGILTFFLALAAAVVAARAAGLAVGWGVQFQQPAFLALMVGLCVLFAANLFGAFEMALPTQAQTAMARTGGWRGLRGDYATGAFAAVMATPCTAPFLGTAVAFALTRGWVEIAAIFGAMGLGLALPYLAVAARPGLVRRLPRPGPWMATLRRGLGALMLAAAVWLVVVLSGAAGAPAALAVGALAGAMLLALTAPVRAARRWVAPIGVAGLAAMVAAAVLTDGGRDAASVAQGPWRPFSDARLAQAVAAGEVVFVDVTADWCLTCKANKRFVLDRPAVVAALDDVVALQADWTRADPAITAYLEGQGRYGIPFNAVYGPGAPDGIVLPELLTEAAVRAALARARGGAAPTPDRRADG